MIHHCIDYDGFVMAILLTGFEPFADHAVNPTAEIARALDGKTIDGVPVVGRVLPVSRAEAWPMLSGWIDEVKPRVVLATGVSNRPGVSLERIARNVDDYPIPDNTGEKATAQAIDPAGPSEYHTDVSVADLRDGLWLDGYETTVSDDAGTYLCNHVYYCLLHAAGNYRALFVHLPRISDGGDPCEDLPLIVATLGWLLPGVIEST